MKITKESIANAERVLIEKGIPADKAAEVLNAVGEALFDAALYDDAGNTLESEFRSIVRWADDDVINSANPDYDEVTPAMAAYWWDHYGRGFMETLTGVSNEALSYIDWESVKCEMENHHA